MENYNEPIAKDKKQKNSFRIRKILPLRFFLF